MFNHYDDRVLTITQTEAVSYMMASFLVSLNFSNDNLESSVVTDNPPNLCSL